MPAYNNVIIMGAARSGTTALTMLLNHDDRVFIGNELCTYTFSRGTPFAEKLRSIENNKNFQDFLLLKKIDIEQLLYYEGNGPSFNEYIHEVFGYSIIGDKLPEYVRQKQFNEWINLNLRLKTIICFRNCEDVVYSTLRRKGQPYSVETPEQGVTNWIADYRHALRILECKVVKEEGFLVVDYDRSTGNISELLSRVSKFFGFKLNIPSPEGAYSSTNIGRWKTEYPTIANYITDEVREITKKMKEYATKI